jgi:site-specific recombinase XerD
MATANIFWQFSESCLNYQIAAKKTGIMKSVYPHLLRHSDAIERLRHTHNPKGLQIHLGHENILYE